MPSHDRDVRASIEAARLQMRAAFDPEWARRVILHLALFPPTALRISSNDDRIEIVPLDLRSAPASGRGAGA